MSIMSRWRHSAAFTKTTLPGIALAMALALPMMSSPADAAGKTITAVMHSDLRVLDPGITTAYIVRDHGYMVYDTLLAIDSKFQIKPQMAEFKVSDDKLVYTFTLRDGLKWHDGKPVTAEDCVASLQRWGRNDGMGQKLMDFTKSIEAPDAKTIVLTLKEPYGLVLDSIAKPSSLTPFMMPKRLAETPAGFVAGLIVAAVVGVIAWTMISRGLAELKANKLNMQRTTNSIRMDAEAVKESF